MVLFFFCRFFLPLRAKKNLQRERNSWLRKSYFIKEISMYPISSFIKRHALVTFFALAYALSWSIWLFEAHSILPFGPLLAALLVLPFVGGWAGVKDFLSRIVQWRVGSRWYLLVLGLPVAVVAVAVGLNILLGATAPMWERVPPLSELPMMLLVIALLFDLGEEPAWRGFD